jgi:hypothetical protein
MSSESRIWEIRPFGSMRGGRELVIGLVPLKPFSSAYSTEQRSEGVRICRVFGTMISDSRVRVPARRCAWVICRLTRTIKQTEGVEIEDLRTRFSWCAAVEPFHIAAGGDTGGDTRAPGTAVLGRSSQKCARKWLMGKRPVFKFFFFVSKSFGALTTDLTGCTDP